MNTFKDLSGAPFALLSIQTSIAPDV